MDMNYCSNCYSPAEPDWKLCPYCDAKISRPAIESRIREAVAVATAERPEPQIETEPEAEPEGHSLESRFSLRRVLIAACLVIRLSGGYRKTNEDNSTRDEVEEMLSQDQAVAKRCDVDKGEAIIEWLREVEASNEYTEKLVDAAREAVRDGEVVSGNMGLLCSAPVAYDNAQRWAEQEPIYAGNPGQNGRQALGRVRIERVRYMSRFDNWLVKGRLIAGPYEGARVSWFAKGEPEVGDVADIRAKVKAHNEEYRETQVSYVQLQ